MKAAIAIFTAYPQRESLLLGGATGVGAGGGVGVGVGVTGSAGFSGEGGGAGFSSPKNYLI